MDSIKWCELSGEKHRVNWNLIRFYFVTVSDAYTSLGHWHRALRHRTGAHFNFMEMAEKRINLFTDIGRYQHCDAIPYYHRWTTLELCVLWSVVSSLLHSMIFDMNVAMFLSFRSIQTLFKTADLMYSIPVHRATIYIIGIFVGYAMRTCKHVELSKTQIFYGWTVSIVMMVSVLMGPAPMGDINYKYNAYHAAFYAALGPMGWCTLFIWIIYTTHLGYSSEFIEFVAGNRLRIQNFIFSF